ncbi:hypothetical protein [Niabella beijingensis]|uniref:hypothetical protein n=1 Tax=Niabella beijingensis TaxID=2872700 RepID=UPI001CBFFA38|nr:hypothetical protein [Niabella beijingensis]MBZ4189419.1 hypothetical protein [Niabella beijingensis]
MIRSINTLHRCGAYLVTALLFLVIFCGACRKGSPGDAGEKDDILLDEQFADQEAFWPARATISQIKNGYFSTWYNSDQPGTVSIWAEGKDLFTESKQYQEIQIEQEHYSGHQYDKGGLLFGLENRNNYYSFQIGDKDFRVFRVVNGKSTNLIDWTPSTAIKGALKNVNRLAIRTANKKYSFLINGTVVYTATIADLYRLDKIGFQFFKSAFVSQHCEYRIHRIKAFGK